MAPFHPLRHEVQVLAARALAAAAVFCVLALILLAGSSDGPLASAEAKKPDAPPVDVSGIETGPPAKAAKPVGGGKQDASAIGKPKATAEPVTALEPAPAPARDTGGSDTTTDKPGNGGNTQAKSPQTNGAGGKRDKSDPGATVASGAAAAGGTPQSETPQAAELPRESGEGAAQRRTDRRMSLRRARAAQVPSGPQPVAASVAATEIPETGFAGSAAAPSDASAEGDESGTQQNGGGARDRGDDGEAAPEEERSAPVRIVRDIVNDVPDSIKFALAALGALSILLGIGYLLAALRNRSLAQQRRELLSEVGLLQTALLPPVPDRVGSLRTSVAYRPADGPGAGGDFYDVLPLPGGRVGFILGDVSGHGRGALARTAFMRYTLRAYLEAGLEPRVALQVAGRVIDENLGGDFATVLLAVHDPETGSLTYATAGHPSPIVVGPQPHEPVTAGSSPPIGVGVRTGLRQTTVPLVPGSVACLFTDGLLEARVNGGMLGRERLEELLDELGPDATARGLIESVGREARVLSDDIAAVMIQPTNGVTAGLFRTEQLELTSRDLDGPTAERFLEACGVPEAEVEAAVEDARMLAQRFGGVILHVIFGNRLRVEVLPRNVESIEAASRRAAAL